MVINDSKVDIITEFADVSSSFSYSSAIVITDAAHGVAERTSTTALITIESGKNTTNKYANSGYTISFPTESKYACLHVKMLLSFILASLTPRIIILKGKEYQRFIARRKQEYRRISL